MHRRQLLKLLSVATLAASNPRIALAQAFPRKPITLLVGGGAGSNPDVIARLVAERLSARLGQAVVIDNKPGAGGIAAMSTLANAAPDGHTIALATMGQVVFNSYLFAKLPYDPQRDLEPVTPFVTGAMVLAAHPSFPANSLPELVALARKRSEPFFLATPALGSPPHIFGLLLMRAAGIEVSTVPYKTGADSMRAAVTGEIPLLIDGPVGIAPLVNAGKLKALAVTGRVREPALPATPTARESGIDAQGEAWIGIVAPVGTPKAIIEQLNREIAAVMAAPEMREQIAQRGLHVLVSTPEDFRAQIRSDHATWGPLIRSAALKLD